MTVLLTLSFLPGGLFSVVAIIFMLCALVVYALYRKDDVQVQFSRGKTRFRLEAKERQLPR